MPSKGQSLSPEVIERMKVGKIKKLQSKFKWELVDQYLDLELNLSSKNRNKKFITMRQFKELIYQGNSLKEINKRTSKHLIQFYSNMAQGKIILSKEEFLKEYDKGLSLEDISKKYKVSRDDMTYLRQLFGEKVKGATFIRRKKIEFSLTKRQKEILYGSMMVDAYKM